MYRLKLLASVAFGIATVLALFLGESAFAEGEKSVELHLTPLHNSEVSGTSNLTEVNGGVKVELNMQGLPEAGVEHINHIHGGGTCEDVQAGKMPPITLPLKTIVANADGTGSATTTIKDVTLDQLLGKDQHRFILVHAKVKQGQGVPPGISCADLPQRTTGSSFENLPSSGGPSPLVLFIVPLALLLASTGAVLVVRRSIA